MKTEDFVSFLKELSERISKHPLNDAFYHEGNQIILFLIDKVQTSLNKEEKKKVSPILEEMIQQMNVVSEKRNRKEGKKLTGNANIQDDFQIERGVFINKNEELEEKLKKTRAKIRELNKKIKSIKQG